MIKFRVTPFKKEILIESLKTAFPNYKIQTRFGGLQVRTSGFTVTGNVKVNLKPKKKLGVVTTQTNYDMLVVFLLFFFPIGIYILIKKEKQIAMEKEVANKIKELLT